MTLSLLFGFFSNLMLAYYAPEKTEQGIASFIGLKTPLAVARIPKCHAPLQRSKDHADNRRNSICRCQIQRSRKFLPKRWRYPPGIGL